MNSHFGPMHNGISIVTIIIKINNNHNESIYNSNFF